MATLLALSRSGAVRLPSEESDKSGIMTRIVLNHSAFRKRNRFAIYESLVEGTLIEARAFRDLPSAADWLAIPVDVLTLKDWPTPPEP